jgi:hypothetical protein
LVEESFSLRTNAMLKKPIAVKTHSWKNS